MDIVNELRDSADGWDACGPQYADNSSLDRRAADEIERLREAVQAYLDAYDNATGTVYVEPLMRKAMEK